jgi:hypothetical protein
MPDIKKISRVASLARGRPGFPSDSIDWNDMFDESGKIRTSNIIKHRA